VTAQRVVALAAVVAALISACVSLESVEMTRPAIGPKSDLWPWLEAPGVRVTAHARHARVASQLVGPGLIVPLPIIPIPVRNDEPGRHFWIDVGIDPEGEDFTLDVRRVRLHLPNRTALAPSVFVGPVMFDFNQNQCGAYREPERMPAVIAMTELVCVSLRFDAAPPPTDVKFSLTLDGLTNRGEPVAPLPIPFEQRRFRRLLWEP
jgi:hypothetical protein